VATVPGTDPDRASYLIAAETAEVMVTGARNILTGADDLAGDIGRAVLTNLHGPRRPRVCARRVKSPLSRWNKHPAGNSAAASGSPASPPRSGTASPRRAEDPGRPGRHPHDRQLNHRRRHLQGHRDRAAHHQPPDQAPAPGARRRTRPAMTSPAPAAGLARPHATAFLDPRHSGPAEDLRARRDPVMARQIAAHVTLIYPEETPPSADPGHLAAAAAARTAPFTIALGPPFYAGSPADGVFFHVHDPDGGISLFRAAVPPGRMIDFPPHVTMVHPRTSGRGRQAWDELAGTHIDARFTITHVAITASRSGSWQALRLLPLTGTGHQAGT
jgi:2'-5' RNA ligase superfamily